MRSIIAIIGYSKSGKTTLLERLIAELTGRGLTVGTIKHSPDEHPPPGRDTDRHLAAGATATVFDAPDRLQFTRSVEVEQTPVYLASRYLDGLDVVLAEGYKQSRLPRIEIFRQDLGEGLITEDRELLLAVTGDRPDDLGDEVPFVDYEDTATLADLIVALVPDRDDRPFARLWVDGQRVPIKLFVQQVLDRGLRGLVSTLHGGRGAQKIELRLDPEPPETAEKEDAKE